MLFQDLRYAVRGLVLAPAFTVTVILTLGLGIGANAAMFAVIDRLMLRPFPHMKDPGSVHRVYVQTTINGKRNAYATVPYARYLDLVGASHSFSQHAAVSSRGAPGRDGVRLHAAGDGVLGAGDEAGGAGGEESDDAGDSSALPKRPMRYLREVRLERARSLLLEGRARAGEVAQSVGFESALHFTRELKRRFGVPPSHYLPSRQAAD